MFGKVLNISQLGIFTENEVGRPSRSDCSVEDLRTGGSCFESLALPIFFLRIDDGHCDRVHSSLTAVHCFYNGNGGKQPVAGKEYFAEYCSMGLWKSMDRPTGHCNITEVMLKMVLNTIRSV